MSEIGTRRSTVIAAGILVAVLLLCGAGGFVYLRPRLSDQYPATLDPPPEIADLRLSDDPELTDAAAQLAAMLDADLDRPVAAVYVAPDDPDRTVAIWGGTGLLRSPADELDAAFAAADAGGFPVAEPTAVEIGPPGGVARCGQGELDELPLSLCGWADHGSLLMAVFFYREPAEAATLLQEIHAGVRAE